MFQTNVNDFNLLYLVGSSVPESRLSSTGDHGLIVNPISSTKLTTEVTFSSYEL